MLLSEYLSPKFYSEICNVKQLKRLQTISVNRFAAVDALQNNSIQNNMNLNRILEESGNITIAVSLVDLKQFAVEIIESTKRDLEEVVISDKAETYPTPKQVCKILNVDASTLWRWNKRGYLCPAMVGGKRRYKMSEVKAILNGGRVK